ncbi:DUF308 domain-containing protein [Carbonactinospora thermoautotrophica]|uniref:Putative integral membrane protein n=1 Tax=Carbonactinospora thermoautotrophica TaxID=1469144 RepID=A0A132MVD3_9ACTN|nr:DUF308 domain-containing protein [Carbonactinospora thermoautotrophica]KWX01764.1 putative integral membrane protein [Carbonactinospora thermoautotrophica]MCX9190910.1 DUF308 domain-containing protein [Carbonactinospora thermoautotrophica]
MSAQPPYEPPPAYGQPAPESRRGGLVTGILALVFGVLSLLSSFTVVLGILFGVLAIALGIAALVRARGPGTGGRKLAGAFGLLLGVLGLIAVAGLTILARDQYEDCARRLGRDPSPTELRRCLEERYGLHGLGAHRGAGSPAAS